MRSSASRDKGAEFRKFRRGRFPERRPPFRAEAGDEAGIFFISFGAAQGCGAERADLGRIDHAHGMALFREKCGGGFPIDSGRFHAGVNLHGIVPLQPDGQLGFGNVDSEDAHLTDTHDKTSCKLNLANAGFRLSRAIDTVQVPAGKTGETGALSTLRTLWFKGQNGIRLSLQRDDGLC